MKIQCDVCEKAPATVICCADEAALCSHCDVEIHAANKLASKHQRLLLESISTNLPPCDICQEKTAFIFCVEDRALFCKGCDQAIHPANTRTANHQRFLATGIRVALGSGCSDETIDETPKPSKSQQVELKTTSHHVSEISSPSWGVDDLLRFSDYETSMKKGQLEFNEFEWLTDMDLFGDQAAEVPQLPLSQLSNMPSYKPPKLYSSHKKPRVETCVEDDEEILTVPDLG